MKTEELKERTKAFALRVIRMINALPESKVSRVISNQILRSATSVGANYRAAAKARSKADFVSKIGIVEEECDETLYWLELLMESKLISAERIKGLIDEANELTAIFTASGRTAKENLRHRQ